jgi:hypothetical protein
MPITSMAVLQGMHIGAAAAHGLQAIIMGVLFGTVQKDRGRFALANYSFDRQTWRTTSRYLKWLIVAFPALSMSNHIYAAVDMSSWRQQHRLLLPMSDYPIAQANAARWIEYSVSASLMVWVIAQLSGVTDLPLLLMLPLLNATMQYCGYMIERSAVWRDRQPFLMIAWAMFVALWLPIVWKFAATAQFFRNPDIPSFVYAIVIIQVLLFVSFGVVSFVFSRFGPTRATGVVDVDAGGERRWLIKREGWYIILSLVAKSLLGWLVVGGALNADRVNTVV